MEKQTDTDPTTGTALGSNDALAAEASPGRSPSPSRPDTDLRSTRRHRLTHAELEALFRADGDSDGRITTPVPEPLVPNVARDAERTSTPPRRPRSTPFPVRPLPARMRTTALAVAAGCTISASALFAYLITPSNSVRPPPVAAAPEPPRPRGSASVPVPPRAPPVVAPVQTTTSTPVDAEPERNPPPPPAPTRTATASSASARTPPPSDLTDKL